MEDSVKQVYELAFTIIPTVAEEKIAEEVGAIKRVLEDMKAETISEENPKMMQLAYSMKKKIGTQTHTFSMGFFGWVKFECDTDKIGLLDESMKKNDHVLRHLIIKTVRENTMPAKVFNAQKAEEGVEAQPITAEDEKKIEESIDELVIE